MKERGGIDTVYLSRATPTTSHYLNSNSFWTAAVRGPSTIEDSNLKYISYLRIYDSVFFFITQKE